MNKALIRYGEAIFLALAVGSVAGLLLIDTPFNAPFIWAWRHLAAPIAVIVVCYTFFCRHELISLTGSRRRVYGTATLLIPLLILFSGGFVSVFNAFCSRGSTVHQGPIQRKFETHGRTREWHIEIYDEAVGGPRTFNVSRDAYASYAVGERYSRTMREGCLGIPYEYRYR